MGSYGKYTIKFENVLGSGNIYRGSLWRGNKVSFLHVCICHLIWQSSVMYDMLNINVKTLLNLISWSQAFKFISPNKNLKRLKHRLNGRLKILILKIWKANFSIEDNDSYPSTSVGKSRQELPSKYSHKRWKYRKNYQICFESCN